MNKIYKYDEFVNEGLLSFLKNAYNFIDKNVKGVKGGKELLILKDKYKSEIDRLFNELINVKMAQKASDANTKVGIKESKNNKIKSFDKLFEDDNAQAQGQAQGQAQSKSQNKPNNAELDKTDIKQKIQLIQKRIEEIKNKFLKEIDNLKKKYSSNGKTTKQFDISINLAQNELGDHIYSKWEEYYNKINDKKTISNIQQQRANIAKKMKENSELLKQSFEQKDATNLEFKIGDTHKYTTSDGKDTTITIKEISRDGKKVIKAENKDGKTINPYTNKIGKKIENTDN